jgi:cytidylate kinase
MRYRVITIARTLGAGGEELGEWLADELGFRYVDDEILDRAAALAGATPEAIAGAESRKGLLSRIAAGLSRREKGAAAAKPAGSGEGYERLIIDAIRETAAMELVVIVAHGAGIALAGREGVLRLLVTANPDVRAKRVAATQGIGHEQALEAIESSDRARADFFRRFYGMDEEFATHYDLVISTDALSAEAVGSALKLLVTG